MILFSHIVYQRIRGRLGNQLNGYFFMLHLQKQYGFQSFLTNHTYNILKKMFVIESITLPVLEETFCYIQQMPFKVKYIPKNFTDHWPPTVQN